MGKIRYEIVEENFSGKSSSSYELSILLRVDSFTYMVIDGQQQILVLKDYYFQINNGQKTIAAKTYQGIVEEDKLLGLPYRNCRMGIAGPAFTLIPNRLFKSAEKEAYLRQLIRPESGVQARVDDLTLFSAKNVYTLDQDILDISMRHFPGCRIFHYNTVLLCGLYQIAANKRGRNLFINLHEKKFSIILFDGSELLFINSFAFQSSKDFIYYVLLVYDQFELKSESVPIFLFGKLVEDSEIYKLLYRYIKIVHFLEVPAYFQLGPKLNLQYARFYYDLMSLIFCR